MCDRIEAAGGRAVRFPLLQIHDTGDSAAVDSVLAELAQFQIAIFVSPNAVHYGLPALERHGGPSPQLKLAAVGRGTARALEGALGRGPELLPETRFDSEGLLALPGLQQVAGKRILILRGNGGRELLGATLQERGARVDYAEVYRRARPAADAAEPRWLERSDIITLTSSEALENLVALTPPPERPVLFAKPLVVVSERAAKLARELGFRQRPWLVPRAGDEEILAALQAWAAENNNTEH
ncbi:MAG: uroporphyrinogen-III synthase [Pseudomonadota bacterium]